ncbi:MAG TPA: site-specific integrase, partial [Promineifilum sp.]|nr:site-specific integrase [Promineifilum sp.]
SDGFITHRSAVRFRPSPPKKSSKPLIRKDQRLFFGPDALQVLHKGVTHMQRSYMVRSRHETNFHFRRRIPRDLRAFFGARHYIHKSLGTSDQKAARIAAVQLALASDIAFAELRRQQGIDLMRISTFTLRVDLDKEGKPKSLTVDAQPHEAEAAGKAARLIIEDTTTCRPADVAIPSRTVGAPSAVLGKRITEVWEGYKQEKIATKAWRDGEDTAKYDHWPSVRDLIEVVGDKPIATVTADDLARYQEYAASGPDGGSPRNRQKHLSRAGAMFRWAKKKRLILDSFSDFFSFGGKIQSNGYLKFDDKDLSALFESDDYRAGKFDYPSQYWLPTLALFTGARLNELCQLTKRDVGSHDGIATISIVDGEFKRLKTAASRRIIPIHSKLIELGFADYVASCRPGRIFPELREDPKRPGDFSREPVRRFMTYRRKVGVGTDIVDADKGVFTGRSRKVFHSFRSNLISALRKAGVPKDRRTRLAGHEYEDTQDRHYTGDDVLSMFDFATLKADIETVQYPIEFTPYDGRLARKR